jgi:hypothetical protein
VFVQKSLINHRASRLLGHETAPASALACRRVQLCGRAARSAPLNGNNNNNNNNSRRRRRRRRRQTDSCRPASWPARPAAVIADHVQAPASARPGPASCRFQFTGQANGPDGAGRTHQDTRTGSAGRPAVDRADKWGRPIVPAPTGPRPGGGRRRRSSAISLAAGLFRAGPFRVKNSLKRSAGPRPRARETHPMQLGTTTIDSRTRA